LAGLTLYLMQNDPSKKGDAAPETASEDELLHRRRLESLGYVAASVAHDFNNLLTPIVANAAVLGETLAEGSRESELAGEILMAAERAAVLVRQMLTLAKPRKAELKRLDVQRAIADMTWLVRRVVRAGVEVAVESGTGDGPLEVMVDGDKLEHALLNLVANSRDAMPAGGRITITTSVVALGQEPSGCTAETTEYVAIAVADTGTGMTPLVRERIFETFFTTKEEGLGTGLGFASVRRFVEASGGCMGVRSEVGQGTTIVLYLPRARPAAARTFSDPPEGDEEGPKEEEDGPISAGRTPLSERNSRGHDEGCAPILL